MTCPPIDLLAGWTGDRLRRFADRIAARGYGAETIAAAESVVRGLPDRLRRPAVVRHLDRSGAAGVLAGLFSYRRALPAAAVADALGEDADALAAAGILVADADGRWSSGLDLTPWDGAVFWHDHLDAGAEAVMGPGAHVVTFLPLLEDGAGADVLDLGCGAGAIAVAAARRGARATGSDINPRAAAMLALNARMNGLEIAAVISDGVGALPTAAFDRILCQPPYLPMPEGIDGRTWLYGGAIGDELILRLIGEMPAALRPGGWMLIRCDLPRIAGRDPLRLIGDRMAAGCDALLLRADGPDAAGQATAFAISGCPALDAGFDRLAEAYLRHFEAQRIDGFARCLVAIRRRRAADAHPPVRAAAELAGAPTLAAIAGRHAGIILADAPDPVLLAARLAVASGARWTVEAGDPALAGERAWRVRTPASPWHAISEAATALAERIAAGGTAAEAVRGYAAAVGGEPAEVRGQALAFIRSALRDGLIVAAGSAPAAGG